MKKLLRTSRPINEKINLNAQALSLSHAWRSTILGQAAGANIKVLRMDESKFSEEVHDFDEALIVLEGKMNLSLNGSCVEVNAGELFIVQAGILHAVEAGSYGTLIIVDK
ncbi:cupin domain-containing protein [Deefgea piscis]|uniref:cupin domain-containing protein n=1 Tax=Deefgea piscis TaxID=2739061 RepID=UPI001C7E5552|nr:cupin domain-containing protein [Deefgea piscis]QZA81636.1 cupin domain-containing protein [Deefgea piscis]